MQFHLCITLRIAFYVIIHTIKTIQRVHMNDPTDITTSIIQMAVLIVVAGIFYFTLKSKKDK